MSRPIETRGAAESIPAAGCLKDSTYTVCGRSITVHWEPDPGQAGRERLDLLLSPYRSAESTTSSTETVTVEGPSADSVWTVRDGAVQERFLGEDELLRQLERSIVAACARYSTTALILHAGAVERDGIALLLPAHSGSGKTTLTLALGARGWRPLTDDICPCVLLEGRVVALPNPRCVHVSDASREVLDSQSIDLEGPVAGLPGYYRPYSWGTAAPLQRIILPCYHPGISTQMVPLTMAEVAAELLLMRFEQDLLPRDVQWNTILQIARQAPGWQLLYSSLDEAFDVVEQIVREPEVTS
jgi:hypothetical protein